MSSDWLPSRRDEILGMAMKWNNRVVQKLQFLNNFL